MIDHRMRGVHGAPVGIAAGPDGDDLMSKHKDRHDGRDTSGGAGGTEWASSVADASHAGGGVTAHGTASRR